MESNNEIFSSIHFPFGLSCGGNYYFNLNDATMKTEMRETSLEAYKGVNLQKREQEVLNIIRAIQPCSNEQIAKAIGWEINRVTGRTNGLFNKGEIKDFDKAKNPRGRNVIRWVVARKQLDLF